MKKGMIKVSVLYPQTVGASFDMDYYCATNLPLVKKLLGDSLKSSAAEFGIAGGAPGSAAPFVCSGHMYFDKIEDFQTSFGPNAGTIMGDLPNFTTIEPTIQISEVRV